MGHPAQPLQQKQQFMLGVITFIESNPGFIQSLVKFDSSDSVNTAKTDTMVV